MKLAIFPLNEVLVKVLPGSPIYPTKALELDVASIILLAVTLICAPEEAFA